MSENKTMTQVEAAKMFRAEMDAIPEEQLLKEIREDIQKHRDENKPE